ncbi:MAG: thiolase family protein [Desulfobacterium sp.]|nr:thiolase family protein [Desulfobacterium sp.]
MAIIDGCRTPFLRSGTGYSSLMGWQIGQFAVQGLLAKTGISHGEIDEVIMGCVAADIATTNIAREISLGAGIPQSVPAYTCTVACISANQAITNAACSILAGNSEVVIAGGVETFSDADIRLSKKYRKFLLDLTLFKRPKKLLDKLKLLKGMGPLDFIRPEKPAISEYATNLIMGENADRLAKRLHITRERQDEYAVMSHQRAAKAQDDGVFDDDIVPVVLNGNSEPVVRDNGPRKDANFAKLSTLKPAFDKKYGSVTAANASFLTDGAAAVLLMGEKKAMELGLEPIGFLKDFAYTAMDPVEELLLGPAFSIGKLLKKTGIPLSDVGVLEIHEAFAAQMLANIDCLESDGFGKEALGLPGAVGKIPRDKLNIYGGSLSIGHPFGATGARLLTTCCKRMKEEKQKFGIVSACAAGAIGNAILIENPSAE